jgi:hypothetical protein
MTSAEACTSWLLRISKALLAESISRLRTSADIVATSAIPNFTTSFESPQMMLGQRAAHKHGDSNALPKTSANTIQPIAVALKSPPPAGNANFCRE